MSPKDKLWNEDVEELVRHDIHWFLFCEMREPSVPHHSPEWRFAFLNNDINKTLEDT